MMELEGKIWKSGKFWFVEVQSIDVCTQGHSRKEALKMIVDAIEVLIAGYFPDEDMGKFKVAIQDYGKKGIGIISSNNSLMVSFSLIRQREISKSTVREIAGRLGSKSPNVYAQYERGKVNITLNQYERLLEAVNPKNPPRLRII
jgi:predicted RNase H-like HicB family nuclease